MAALTGIGMFGFSTHTVVVQLLAERDLGGDARTFTLLVAALSAGSLHSTRTQWVDRRAPARAAIAFGVLNGLMGLAPTVPSALVASAATGYLCVLAAGTNAVLQLRRALQMRGRVTSLGATLMLGRGPIGGPVDGPVVRWIAEVAGAPSALVFRGAVSAATGWYVVAWLNRHHSA
jgi:hypothetical protein